jgi:ribosomal protein L37E
MVARYRKVEKRLCLCGTRLKPGYGICVKCIRETAKKPEKESNGCRRVVQCDYCGTKFVHKYRKYCSDECMSKSCPERLGSLDNFLKLSKAIHGDKYDYSLSVWSGSEKPITITCRKCGPITLARASYHYRKDKPSGCRFCAIEESLVARGRAKKCIKCGSRSKYMIKGMCVDCRKDAKLKRNLKTELSHTRHCRHCNLLFTAKRKDQFFCCRECGCLGKTNRRHESGFVVVYCDYCHISFEKPKSLVRERNCCSKSCQQKFALFVKRSKCRRNDFDWLSASMKAKRQWYARSHRKRIRKWIESNGFLVLAKKWISRAGRPSPDKWKRKCLSVKGAFRVRVGGSANSKACFPINSWSVAIKSGVSKIESIKYRSVLGKWRKKCETSARGLRRRNHFRLRKKNTSMLTDNRELQLVQLRLWE